MFTLQNSWPLISILLLVALAAAIILVPSSAGIFIGLMLLLGPGMAIFFIVAREIWAYRAYQIDQAAMIRNIFFEVLGLLLAIALAILLVQVVIGLITSFVGGSSGLVIVMVTAMLVGLGASWLIKVTWGELIRLALR